MKHPTTRSRQLSLCLFTVLLLAAGCQATPQTAAVVPGGEAERKLQNTSAPFTDYSAPARWTETLVLKGNDKKIQIDAEVILPQVAAVPVCTTEERMLDKASVERMAAYFTQGRQVMKYRPQTRAELEQELILVKKGGDSDLPQIAEVGISEQVAKVAAQTVLQALGIDYMTAVQYQMAQMHFWLSGNTTTLSSEKPSCKGYCITFARSIDGVLHVHPPARG